MPDDREHIDGFQDGFVDDWSVDDWEDHYASAEPSLDGEVAQARKPCDDDVNEPWDYGPDIA